MKEKTSIYCLGDLHLSAANAWRLKIGENFLNWFEELNVDENEENYFIGLGDYTDDSVNPGEVIYQLIKFFQILEKKFKRSYLLVGNHDLKRYKDIPNLSFKAAERFKNITILQNPAEIIYIDNVKILSLPFYNYRLDYKPMYDYYNNLPDSITSQEYDLVIGHFADETINFFGNKVNLSKIKTKYRCLGDIHVKLNQNYIGSAIICKISEENPGISPRSIWKFVKNNKTNTFEKFEIPIPISCEYKEIIFPERMIENHPITIWTVKGAPNEEEVYKKYPNKYIRLIITKIENDIIDVFTKDENFKLESYINIFENWKKESKIILNRGVEKVIRSLLQKN